jgi:thymidine kinase
MSSPGTKTGFLSGYIGPMYSSKTSRMIKELTTYAELTSLKPLIVNHSMDTRDTNNKISTHNPLFKGLPSNIDVISTSKLSDIDISNYDVIGIDECQFYIDLYDTVLKWLNLGKHITISGLNGDAQRKLFGDLYKLLSHFDKLEYCTAICKKCLSEFDDNDKVLTPDLLSTMTASFTKKINGDKDLIVDVGAKDKYVSMCRKHYEDK